MSLDNFESTIDPEFSSENIGTTAAGVMRYPCIVLDGGIEISESLVGTIATLSKPVTKIVKGSDGLERTEELVDRGQNIALYLEVDGVYNLIGLLNGAGVTAILDLLETHEGVKGYLDANTVLEGNNIFILRGN